jgi:transcriptional regulator with XRE-family HTH domain
MGMHKTWRELRAERRDDPAYRAAYDRARHAYEIGRKVRELREARAMTQAELAARMGSSQSVIARLELGGAEPRLDTLERVAQALDAALVLDLRPREGTDGASSHQQRARSS